MADYNITGTLKDWKIEHKQGNKYVLNGKIYNDIRNRFLDGTEITTSRLLSIEFEDGIAYTENSIYKLENN